MQDVLADADTRSSLSGEATQVGYGAERGFYIATPDGNFKLNLGGQLHLRYAADFQSTRDNTTLNAVPGSGANRGTTAINAGSYKKTAYGFGVRRMKLDFFGHVIDPSWQWRVVLIYNQNSNAIQTPGGNNNSGSAGSSTTGMEEVMVNDGGSNANMGAVSGFNNGSNNPVTIPGLGNVEQNNGVGSAQWAVTGHLGYMPFGDWKEFNDFSSYVGDKHGLLFEAWFNWQRGGEQGGWFITDPIELYARWEWLNTQNVGVNDIPLLPPGTILTTGNANVFNAGRTNVYTPGFNWFLGGKHVKLTTDVSWCSDPLWFNNGIYGAGIAGTDFRIEPKGGGDQIVVRSQLQLVF